MATDITYRHRTTTNTIRRPGRLADAVSEPGVTLPLMPGIMDLEYLDTTSRGGLALPHPGQDAANETTLEG